MEFGFVNELCPGCDTGKALVRLVSYGNRQLVADQVSAEVDQLTDMGPEAEPEQNGITSGGLGALAIEETLPPSPLELDAIICPRAATGKKKPFWQFCPANIVRVTLG